MTSFAFASFTSTTLGAAIVTVANQIDEHTVYVQVTSPGFIATIIIGLLAGWIAGHITRGRGFGWKALIPRSSFFFFLMSGTI